MSSHTFKFVCSLASHLADYEPKAKLATLQKLWQQVGPLKRNQHLLACRIQESATMAELSSKYETQNVEAAVEHFEDRINKQQQGSNLFECPKCNQRNCTYIQLQTRSGDEAMTNFCQCLHCNNRWRE